MVITIPIIMQKLQFVMASGQEAIQVVICYLQRTTP